MYTPFCFGQEIKTSYSRTFKPSATTVGSGLSQEPSCHIGRPHVDGHVYETHWISMTRYPEAQQPAVLSSHYMTDIIASTSKLIIDVLVCLLFLTRWNEHNYNPYKLKSRIFSKNRNVLKPVTTIPYLVTTRLDIVTVLFSYLVQTIPSEM